MTRLTDSLNMTIAVDWDVKERKKKTKTILIYLKCTPGYSYHGRKQYEP